LKKKTLLKNQKGATAVEFAIILPLFITLIFGIVEFGLYLFNKQVITNAAREGARFGIVVRSPRISNDEIKAKVIEFSEQHLVTFGSGTIVVPTDPDTMDKPFFERRDSEENLLLKDADGNPILGGFGDSLTVEVTYPYDSLFLSSLGVDITAKCTMRME